MFCVRFQWFEIVLRLPELTIFEHWKLEFLLYQPKQALLTARNSPLHPAVEESHSHEFLQFLAYETSFRIYIVDSCHLSSIREVVSKKIKTCNFKPIQIQFRQKNRMLIVSNVFFTSLTEWHLVKPSSTKFRNAPFFAINRKIKP